MANRSLADLVSFLDYLADKGLMTSNAVAGRKAAVTKVLGALDPEEVEDVMTIDLDHAMMRFINKEGKSYKPGSLASYKSRAAASIVDFESYLKNPVTFKPAGGQQSAKSKVTGASGSGGSAPKKKPAKKAGGVSDDVRSDTASSSPNVLPIPIRENLVVRIFGLPFDLKANEANKIASVVKAMAMETD